MANPTTPTDSNGKLVSVGNGAQLDGKVTAVANGQATVTLSDAYGVAGVVVTVPCYAIRQQKIER